MKHTPGPWPELLEALQKLSGIIESIRSDETSLSATEEISELSERDRVSRINFYRHEIAKAAEQIDDALESSFAAIAKATAEPTPDAFIQPIEDWKYDVANGDTQLGYDDWVRHNIESHSKPASK